MRTEREKKKRELRGRKSSDRGDKGRKEEGVERGRGREKDMGRGRGKIFKKYP